ncbi:MAG: serine hydrolase [Limosilactobacillus pontis]
MKARAAYAIDAQTGQVLYQKNANKVYPIASLTKILTLAVIEDIRDHRLSWKQKVKIRGSKVANDWHLNVQLNAGEEYSIRQLAESMMIVSADGSAEALALAVLAAPRPLIRRCRRWRGQLVSTMLRFIT